MENDGYDAPLTTSKPTLADLLTIEQSASIFYSYARELELSAIFSDVGASSTLFVPTNRAVMALARKPHEGSPSSPDGEIHVSDKDFDRKAKANVERWISAHIIPESPITLDSTSHATLLSGKSLSFKPISKHDGQGPEWSRVTLEDGIHIIGKKEALNGVVYMIDRSISLD